MSGDHLRLGSVRYALVAAVLMAFASLFLPYCDTGVDRDWAGGHRVTNHFHLWRLPWDFVQHAKLMPRCFNRYEDHSMPAIPLPPDWPGAMREGLSMSADLLLFLGGASLLAGPFSYRRPGLRRILLLLAVAALLCLAGQWMRKPVFDFWHPMSGYWLLGSALLLHLTALAATPRRIPADWDVDPIPPDGHACIELQGRDR